MRSKIGNIFSLLSGLLIISVIGFFLFKIVNLIIDKIDKLDANIIVAILAGTFTIIGYFVTRFLEKQKIIEQQIREQKLPIYEEFIEFIFKVFENSKSDDKMSEEEMQKFFWKINKKSILWLSDNTLNSYIIWKNGLIESTESKEDDNSKGKKLLIDFEKLLMDFRNDI